MLVHCRQRNPGRAGRGVAGTSRKGSRRGLCCGKSGSAVGAGSRFPLRSSLGVQLSCGGPLGLAALCDRGAGGERAGVPSSEPKRGYGQLHQAVKTIRES